MKLFDLFKKNGYQVSSIDQNNIRKGYLDLHDKYELLNYDIVGAQKCSEKMLNLTSIKEPIEIADLYNDIGNRFAADFSKYSSAIPYYKNALTLFDTLLEHSNTATYGNLAQCYFVEKNYSECISVNEKLVNLNKLKHGENYRNNSEVYALIGDSYNMLNKHDIAAKNYIQAIIIVEQNEYYEKYDDLVYFNAMVGKSYYMNKQFEESLKYYKIAKSLIEKYRKGYEHKTTIDNSIADISKKIEKKA